LKSANEIRFLRQIKEVIKQSITLSIGIKYSLRDPHFDVNNYAWPTK